jgi:hypothetical protein
MRSAGRASRARDQHGMLNRKAADPCLRFDNAGNLQLHLTSDVGIVEIAARRRNGHDFTKSAGPWVAMWHASQNYGENACMEAPAQVHTDTCHEA